MPHSVLVSKPPPGGVLLVASGLGPSPRQDDFLRNLDDLSLFKIKNRSTSRGKSGVQSCEKGEFKFSPLTADIWVVVQTPKLC